MVVSRRDFLKIGGLATLSVGSGSLWGFAKIPVAQAQAISPITHLLNRMTWGARAQDHATVERMGIEAYIDAQLNYESLPDPLIDEFLGQRRAFSMPPQELRALAEERYEAVYEALLWGRLFRAIYSERQLFEVMVEFWSDHFSIPAPDYLADKLLDDKQVIRTHALGTFRALLLASAQSPAMLRYLDNAVSSAEHPNENYARELLELHTLGVDGGYTEQDVLAVARAFTGWTLTGYNGDFKFDFSIHDTQEKVILGITLPANRGIEDGLQVLDILANHPATARFISTKLCRKFVSDVPPESLINSTAQVFLESYGDIKVVVRHILTSSAFESAVGQKFRRPMEFVVAMIRALTPYIRIENAYTVISALEPMGHVPFHWFPPNGYPDVQEAWMNTNGLLYRWNHALALGLAGDGYVSGITLNTDSVVPDAPTVGAWVDGAVDRLLHMPISAQDRDLLLRYATRDGNPETPLTTTIRYEKLGGIIGLLFASPYFQWH